MMTLTGMLVLIACLLLTIYFAVKLYIVYRWYNYWKKRNVYCFDTVFPTGNAGSIFSVRKSFAEVFTEKYSKIKAANKKEAGFFFLFTPQYVPIDPEIIKNILLKDFQYFMDRGVYYNERDDPLSAHLFTMEGQRWKTLRGKLSPTFTSGKMKLMFPAMVTVAMQLIYVVKERESSEPVEMKELMARFTTDIIGTCAFGIECNSLKDPDTSFMVYGKKIFAESRVRKLINFLTFVFPNMMRFFRVRQLPKESTDFFMNVIRETVKYREENNVTRKDFMDLLLQLKHNGKLDDENDGEQVGDSKTAATLTLEQMAGQAFVFFVAGFETSSSTMSFCLYEVACNEDIQEKLRNEVTDVFDKYRGKLTYEGIAEMKYMDMILSETLRKYPSLPVLNRVCTMDYTVPQTDLLLEKGTQVIIPIEGLHYDPDYFPDPYKFDPERFNDENKASILPFTYLPFGDGPRICIGMRFGLLMTKIMLALLIKDFRFRLNARTPEPIVMDRTKFLNTALGGIWVDITDI